MRFVTMFLLAAVIAPPAIAQDAAPVEAAKPKKKKDVGFGPTPMKRVRQMLDLAEVKPGDIVYDLGSGDGRIPITAVKEYGARGIGIEIDGKLLERSAENARIAGVDGKVEFRNEDIFTADFSDATVITLFLWPSVNRRLVPKLMQLKPGTRVVSYWHTMKDWKPAKVVKGGLLHDQVYLWIIPERGNAERGGGASSLPK